MQRGKIEISYGDIKPIDPIYCHHFPFPVPANSAGGIYLFTQTRHKLHARSCGNWQRMKLLRIIQPFTKREGDFLRGENREQGKEKENAP